MKALRFLLVLTLFVPAAFMASSCEYQYRYACQDPANWNNEECQRPACEVDGVCPDMLLGRTIVEGNTETVEGSNNNCCCCDNNSEGEL
jgi:hypothetical protein